MHINSISTTVNSFIQKSLVDAISPMTKIIIAIVAGALACLAIALTALYYGGFLGKKSSKEELIPDPVKIKIKESAEDSLHTDLIKDINEQKAGSKYMKLETFLEIAEKRGKEIHIFNLETCPELTAEQLQQIVTYCPNLTLLRIESSVIDSSGFAPLAKLQHLAVLDLTRCKISDAHLAEVAKVPALMVLKLYGYIKEYSMHVTDAGLAEIAKIQSLEQLRLYSFTFTSKGWQCLSKLQKLQVLYLQECKGVNDEAVEQFATMASLKHLALMDAEISDKGVSHLTKLTQLIDLKLNECFDLTDAALDSIAQITSLEFLNLDYAEHFTNDAFTKLKPLKVLKRLSLENVKGLNDEGVKNFVFALPQLQEVSLSHCLKLTDSDLECLANFLQLKNLDLSYCEKITDKGLAALASKQKKLEMISLLGCPLVTEEGRKKFTCRVV